jgi:radical SAM protein with 4Fe4S-binding SPASM domain
MVHVNGDLTTCCLDEHLVNRLGNVRETPLEKLWQGKQLHQWRLAQAQGSFEESGPYCTRCNWQSAGAYPEEAVEAYLERTGEQAALVIFRRQRAHKDE